MVEVVAAELRKHDARWSLDGNRSRLECDCGAEVIAGDATAHQARAVLAALTEAGSVEWGVAWKGAGPDGVLAFDSEEDAREAVELGGLLSRLTLPWTAVEQ